MMSAIDLTTNTGEITGLNLGGGVPTAGETTEG
jgi:hypothetical protein